MVKFLKRIKNLFCKKKRYNPFIYDKKDFDECVKNWRQLDEDYTILF